MKTIPDTRGFTGTEEWHVWSSLFRQYLLTDGAKYIADECGAYWLMDLIASHMMTHPDEPFAVVDAQCKDNAMTVALSDGNGRTFAQQHVEWTDFPEGEIQFYVVDHVILLPSEY